MSAPPRPPTSRTPAPSAGAAVWTGPRRPLLAPTVGTGVLMAAYLVLRPYADMAGATTRAAAEAFASPWWIVAHLCGALALASFGRLALRLADVDRSLTARVARFAGLAGTVLVLPYYGAETFGLHALGRRALEGDMAALELVGVVRDQPAAMTMFVLGLLLLAVAGVLVALTWHRRGGRTRWAAWPLGLMVAAIAPQFYLPPEGRITFGIAYAVAAATLAVAAVGARDARPATRRRSVS